MRDRRIETLSRLGEGERLDDFAAHYELMRPDFRDYRLGAADPVTGVDAYAETVGEFRRSITDYEVYVPVEPIVDRNHVTTLWEYRGRVTSPLWGLQPSDREFRWRGCSVWTFDEDDLIVELRTFADLGQLLNQIVVP